MLLETLNRTVFAALDATHAGPGAQASLEALAVVPVYGLPLLVAALWLLGDRDARSTAIAAAMAACLAMLAAHAASLAVVHPRPFMLGLAPNRFDHAADSSFPSDHATLFFALATAFARRPVPGLPGLAALLGVLGVGVGLARVALGVHFPLDIVGAATIGTGAAMLGDLGLGRLRAVIFAVGERLRRHVGPLAARDRGPRELHARSPR